MRVVSGRFLLVAAAFSALSLAGCATTSNVDPFERANRVAYAFNEPLERDLVRPMIEAYVENVPEVVRQVVGNFFGNIGDFFSGVNGLLQAKPEKAGHDFGRVIVNSLAGFGGLIDFASEAGIPQGEEDFGQTFGVWGIPQGPYLFIPLFGPMTVRDGTGFVVRVLLDPTTEIPNTALRWSTYVLEYVNLRSDLLEGQTMAEKAALDPYTFIRRSYLQRREYLTYDGNPPPEKDED